MTKIGNFVFFRLPPDGSGVSPKSRIERYFLRRSVMQSRGNAVWSWQPRGLATPQPRDTNSRRPPLTRQRLSLATGHAARMGWLGRSPPFAETAAQRFH